MFFRISYKAWHNVTMKHEKRERELAMYGQNYVSTHMEDQSKFEEVTIELEPEECEYTSDEDTEASVSRGRPHTRGAITTENFDHEDTSVLPEEKSPEVHRRKVKMQKTNASRRFSQANFLQQSGVFNQIAFQLQFTESAQKPHPD